MLLSRRRSSCKHRRAVGDLRDSSKQKMIPTSPEIAFTTTQSSLWSLGESTPGRSSARLPQSGVTAGPGNEFKSSLRAFGS